MYIHKLHISQIVKKKNYRDSLDTLSLKGNLQKIKTYLYKDRSILFLGRI